MPEPTDTDVERLARILAKRYSGFRTRSSNQPVDVSRIHREMAGELLEAGVQLPEEPLTRFSVRDSGYAWDDGIYDAEKGHVVAEAEDRGLANRIASLLNRCGLDDDEPTPGRSEHRYADLLVERDRLAFSVQGLEVEATDLRESRDAWKANAENMRTEADNLRGQRDAAYRALGFLDSIAAMCREHPAWVEPEVFSYDDVDTFLHRVLHDHANHPPERVTTPVSPHRVTREMVEDAIAPPSTHFGRVGPLGSSSHSTELRQVVDRVMALIGTPPEPLLRAKTWGYPTAGDDQWSGKSCVPDNRPLDVPPGTDVEVYAVPNASSLEDPPAESKPGGRNLHSGGEAEADA
ncbi:MAG TPA: hypothetical protein VGW74_10565 [Propionibacteriaceae bacterium]|nr:hypothetical protein [Propionibacteriaceae bacterium]